MKNLSEGQSFRVAAGSVIFTNKVYSVSTNVMFDTYIREVSIFPARIVGNKNSLSRVKCTDQRSALDRLFSYAFELAKGKWDSAAFGWTIKVKWMWES